MMFPYLWSCPVRCPCQSTPARSSGWHPLFCAWLALAISLAASSVVRANTRYLITQQGRYDCGPAALATLLHSYLDVPMTEAEAVRLTKAHPRTGTTLLGLENAATAKGCAAGSFRMSYETLQKQLATYPMPVIVRTINPEPHFSVLLAIHGDALFLADPATGNILLGKEAFLRRWLIPTTKEGFVFIAMGTKPADGKHRLQVVQELAQQLGNLQTIRPPIAGFRR
jgi:predicted double-glycine peptidase